jgi:hypothetical protein
MKVKSACILPLGILFFQIFSACDEAQRSPIPYRPVDITLDLNFGDADLIPPLATKTIIQKRLERDKIGFGGVLVINGYSSEGEVLFAYDLACPVEVDQQIRVIPDNTGKAHCSQCKAIYNLAFGNGYPESGSKYSLRPYGIRPEGINKYRVIN